MMYTQLRIGFVKRDRNFIVYMPMDESAVVFENFKPQHMVAITDIIPFEMVCPNPKLLGPELLNKLGSCFCEMAGVALAEANYAGYHDCMKKADRIQNATRDALDGHTNTVR